MSLKSAVAAVHATFTSVTSVLTAELACNLPLPLESSSSWLQMTALTLLHNLQRLHIESNLPALIFGHVDPVDAARQLSVISGLTSLRGLHICGANLLGEVEALQHAAQATLEVLSFPMLVDAR